MMILVKKPFTGTKAPIEVPLLIGTCKSVSHRSKSKTVHSSEISKDDNGVVIKGSSKNSPISDA